MRVLGEWLQKHPTPAAADGDFHWWPGEVDAALRATIADGAGDDLTLWLAPDRVIAAQRFTAIAPADGRRYAGLAVTIAEGAGTPELLAALPTPPAAPWSAGLDPGRGFIEPPLTIGQRDASHAIAAMWRGGVVRALTIGEAAAIEAWMPAEVRARSRRLQIGGHDHELGELAGVARWLSTAMGAAGEMARQAWHTVEALARVEGRDVAVVVAELEELDRAWASAAGVRAYLATVGIALDARLHVAGDGDDQWARALNGWGRGRVAGDLAAVIARRGGADRLRGDRDAARRWRRILRWEALLPARRADELARATLARLPVLAEDSDG